MGLPFGLTVSDLVHDGWIAWHEARNRSRTETYPFERARFAMLDTVRRWRLSLHTDWREGRGLTAAEMLASYTVEDFEPAWNRAGTPVQRHRLSRTQIGDLRTCFLRHLSPTDAALLIATVIDGESLELATATHKGKTGPHQLRNNAHRKIMQVLAGQRGGRGTRGQCTVPGCLDRTKAKELCRRHYWLQHASGKRQEKRRLARSA
jgi:DNA-directed RNA polymerase specialized sigma24 family protein